MKTALMVKRFAEKIKKALEESGYAVDVSQYKPSSGKPIHCLDPRSSPPLFFLRSKKKSDRPDNRRLNHNWSCSIVNEQIRLRVTIYNQTRKYEKQMVRILQEIANECDTTIALDTMSEHATGSCDHFGKYLISCRKKRYRGNEDHE